MYRARVGSPCTKPDLSQFMYQQRSGRPFDASQMIMYHEGDRDHGSMTGFGAQDEIRVGAGSAQRGRGSRKSGAHAKKKKEAS